MICHRCGEEFADELGCCPYCKEREERAKQPGYVPPAPFSPPPAADAASRIYCKKCGNMYENSLPECPHCKLAAAGGREKYCEKCGRTYMAEYTECPYCKIMEEELGAGAPATRSTTAAGPYGSHEPHYDDYDSLGGWLAFLLVRIILGIVLQIVDIGNLSRLRNTFSLSPSAGTVSTLIALEVIFIISEIAMVILIVKHSKAFRPLYVITVISLIISNFVISATLSSGSGTIVGTAVMEFLWIGYLFRSKRVDTYFGYYNLTLPPRR